MRARAKAEKAKAAREFRQKEAMLRKQQAELAEQEAFAHAKTQRKRQELEVDHDMLKEERVYAKAEAEAEAYEDFLTMDETGSSRRLPSSLPKVVESSYERTKAYVDSHSSHSIRDNYNQETVGLRPTAPVFSPYYLAASTDDQPQGPGSLYPNAEVAEPKHAVAQTIGFQGSVQPKDEALPSLVHYLLRKDLTIARLTNFNDRADMYLHFMESYFSICKVVMSGFRNLRY